MRNYWIRILIGASVIFVIGMIGVTLVHNGLTRVHNVVHGSGPISIPLAIIPFDIGGSELGTLDRLVLQRTAPKNISSVRVEVKLKDSLVAQGLSGCKLAANFEADHKNGHDLQVKLEKGRRGTFRCLKGDPADTSLVEFGLAVLQPGDVSLPLFLPREMVEDLKRGNFLDDSSEASDSLSDAMEALGDSISDARERKADSLTEVNAGIAESLRTVGQQRVDSIAHLARRLADSLQATTLKRNAPRTR